MAGQADNIPFVLRAISPDYVGAMEGLKRLESTMALVPKESGFKEISNIFHKELSTLNPTKRLEQISIIKIDRRSPSLRFNRKRAKEIIPITFHLSDGQQAHWNLEILMDRVKKLKKGNVFIFAIAIFAFGVIIQFIGFVIQTIEKTNKVARKTSGSRPLSR